MQLQKIKNLIVSGCSFTAVPDHVKGWSELLATYLNADNYVNLAYPGAGNRYIAESLVDHLSRYAYDPESTLVIPMWSGISRKDMIVDEDEYYSFKGDMSKTFVNKKHYIFSGGYNGLWLDQSDANYKRMQKLFKEYYMHTSEREMHLLTVEYMQYLKDFLDSKKYNYRFTTFTKYWHSTWFYAEESLDSIDAINLNAATNKEVGSIYRAKWLPYTIHEEAQRLNSFDEDGFHPGPLAHLHYAMHVLKQLR